MYATAAAAATATTAAAGVVCSPPGFPPCRWHHLEHGYVGVFLEDLVDVITERLAELLLRGVKHWCVLHVAVTWLTHAAAGQLWLLATVLRSG